MKIDEAAKYIREHPEKHLQKARKQGYQCPICGSGKGKNGTGITTQDGIHFKCWAGNCFSNADMLDIIGLEFHLPTNDFIAKVKKAAEVYGISIDDNYTPARIKPTHTYTHTYTHTHKEESPKMNTQDNPTPEPPDYTAFYLEANKHLPETEYWKSRGLSKELLDKFNVGYCKDWTHPKYPKTAPTPRLIIPTGKSSYAARAIKEEDLRYLKVSSALFNGEALYNSDRPVFITEGEIDALSIMEAGGVAVGLGSKSYGSLLAVAVKKQRPTQPLILALDNDKEGIGGNEDLAKKLKELGVTFSIETENLYQDCKDANEALLKDKKVFSNSIKAAESRALCVEAEEADAKQEELKREAIAYSLDDFLQKAKTGTLNTKHPTYFTKLDEALGGGLHDGLYIVGAVSSLGKTTFCMQMADQLARQGYNVLVFSIEMAVEDLIAKSLSRQTYLYAKNNEGTLTNAMTSQAVKDGGYTPEKQRVLDEAVVEYREFSTHLYITGERVTVADIREKVQSHHAVLGTAPIVLIDYLQIMAPPGDMQHALDKQIIDRNVSDLKRLSREFKIPVIGISSFNRENYNSSVNLASFKESGAIEYSSDVLIGLQYSEMEYRKGETSDSAARKQRIYTLQERMTQKAKQGNEGAYQRVQLKVLKSRNAARGSVYFRYVPMFNYFEEDLNQEPDRDEN